MHKPNEIWGPALLVQEGRIFNVGLRMQLKDFCSEAGGIHTDLWACVAFTSLCIANLTRPDRVASQTQKIFALLAASDISDAALKDLAIRRWSPVKRMILAYGGQALTDRKPASVGALIRIQEERHDRMSPSWATTMPDKMFALHHFEKPEEAEGLTRLLPPFGKAVQTAYDRYTGSEIAGAPKKVHHEQLREMQRLWADLKIYGARPGVKGETTEADRIVTEHSRGTVLDVNSGLYRYGLELLGGRD